MSKSVIVSAARTPYGKFGGGLKSFSAMELGGLAIAEAVQRAGLSPEQIDYVYMGHVLQAGCGQVTSRQASRKAGLPWETPSITVNKVCSSGIVSVELADMRIRSGRDEIIVAGGMESMSNAPYALPDMRWGARMQNRQALDLMVHDGLWCSFYDRHMAVHGSEVAAEFGISREAQDEWALRSHHYAAAAMSAGRLDAEIFPVSVRSSKGESVLSKDESPRGETTLEALAKLPPVFSEEGSVTAGNAPGVNDGGAALVLMSASRAAALGLKPLATILGQAEVSQPAQYIATVPGLAMRKLLAEVGVSLGQIDLIEVNEAFAAVALTSGKIVGWNPDRVNVDGGAIAFGHPIGSSGARILMHLIFALRARGGGQGVACICSGAAQGDALLVRVE
ncbi:MAG: acetyl-CoA C-acetyltransferase [Deltaproteobacteria bacterium]|jgi:acetyl-CoA C-acetyltransferase|nr:acetyl-CoA C-acetyltransferase [Deltaproteobacteria bacterium]